jgi:hypothetical protein
MYRSSTGLQREKIRRNDGRKGEEVGEEEGISYDENGKGDVKPVMREGEGRRGWYGRNLHCKGILE